jgi:hypothetical protein
MKTGHELVDHLITYAPPGSEKVIQDMETVRRSFLDIGHLIADVCPDGPDQTVAIRKLHDACQAAIGCLALNQGGEVDE